MTPTPRAMKADCDLIDEHAPQAIQAAAPASPAALVLHWAADTARAATASR